LYVRLLFTKEAVMYGQISTFAFVGIDARAVEVQARLSPGRFVFSVVGLPDKAVGESRERVLNALHAAGLGLPGKRVTVNLAPADLPKEGSHFDLPIALALLVALGAFPAAVAQEFCAIGELALDGSIRGVPGALPSAVAANALGRGLICPETNGSEAAWASESMPILGPHHLLPLIGHFAGSMLLPRPLPKLHRDGVLPVDLADVKGQESAKRALEVAAAGGHNLLMIGPPGSGKSMLAARMPTILPPLTVEEMLEVSMVQSLVGGLPDGAIETRRPFRAPHHSASMPALVGGGVRPRPGEVSLAHHGVLFLDELPEFPTHVLDALRQPLEAGEAVIARVNHRMTYPAQFQLVAAMNPCKCGGGVGQSCRRGAQCAATYQARVSGPFMDRMDLTIEVPAVTPSDLAATGPRETSETVRHRVARARAIQAERYRAIGGAQTLTNARCSAHALEATLSAEPQAMRFLANMSGKIGLTARGYHRVLRVARTLADLDDEAGVAQHHIAEAMSYRRQSADNVRLAS
jgi:magnesium chelatase family protein